MDIPEKFINRYYYQRRSTIVEKEPDPTAILILPYIQGLSDSIKRILSKNLGIRTVFKPTNSLRRILSHPKDPLPSSLHCGVVYRIPCMDCSKSYVGQTLRTLDRRLKEHKRAVVMGDTASSALVEHLWTSHHRIAWDDTAVLCQHQSLFQRCLLESWFIHRLPDLVNRESGSLPECYAQLIETTPSSAPPDTADT